MVDDNNNSKVAVSVPARPLPPSTSPFVSPSQPIAMAANIEVEQEAMDVFYKLGKSRTDKAAAICTCCPPLPPMPSQPSASFFSPLPAQREAL